MRITARYDKNKLFSSLKNCKLSYRISVKGWGKSGQRRTLYFLTGRAFRGIASAAENNFPSG